MTAAAQHRTDLPGTLGADYAQADGHRPLAGYAVLSGAFGAALAGALLAARASGRPLPERLTTQDVLLAGVATHKLSRLIAKDKVTSFLRAPFTRYQESAGHGELEEEPRGEGLRLATGELLVCPYCLAQWIAAGLYRRLRPCPSPDAAAGRHVVRTRRRGLRAARLQQRREASLSRVSPRRHQLGRDHERTAAGREDGGALDEPLGLPGETKRGPRR
jgi:hypothetical protein